VQRLVLSTSWGELRLVGGSRAGEATLLLLPQLRLALDAGRASRALVPMQHVLVSHGHMDHVQGLVGWASQRQLQGMPAGHVWAPGSLAPAIVELLALAARMEGGKPYDVSVHPVSGGDQARLSPQIVLRFFTTSHWVETLGCCLVWERRRLRPELAGTAPDELQRRREAGEEISEGVAVPILAYLADTGPGVFDLHPWLGGVEVLVMECSFLRPTDRDRARRFGHIHLDDVVELAGRLTARHLVLTHLSRRHRLAAGSRIIRAALRSRLTPALHLLNVEWD
jgi:ribonuclease Z